VENATNLDQPLLGYIPNPGANHAKLRHYLIVNILRRFASIS
jgi:hypothetical protein